MFSYIERAPLKSSSDSFKAALRWSLSRLVILDIWEDLEKSISFFLGSSALFGLRRKSTNHFQM